jgi:hypothetical protein
VMAPISGYSSDESQLGDNVDEDELGAPVNVWRVDVMIRIPQTSLAVRMYNPANGSEPDHVLPDVDEVAGVGCSGAGPGGSILRSSSSPMANVSDPKVNWVLRGNFISVEIELALTLTGGVRSGGPAAWGIGSGSQQQPHGSTWASLTPDAPRIHAKGINEDSANKLDL